MTSQMTSQSHDSAGDVDGTSHNLTFYFVLVDKLEDVRCIDEDRRGSSDSDGEEYTQLKSVDHHRNVSPVIENLAQQTTHAP